MDKYINALLNPDAEEKCSSKGKMDKDIKSVGTAQRSNLTIPQTESKAMSWDRYINIYTLRKVEQREVKN